jgi:hypothetical protein
MLDAGGSRDHDGSIAAYAWDLDDDGAFDDAAGRVVAHRFAAAGDRTVSVRITDDEGAVATAGRVVAVQAAPDPPPPDPGGSEGPGAPPATGAPPGDDAPAPDPPAVVPPADPPAGSDASRPRGALAPRAGSLRSVLRRGLAVAFSSSEDVTATFRVRVDARTARRLRLPGASSRSRSRSPVTIGKARRRVKAGRASVRVRIGRRPLARVRRLAAGGKLRRLPLSVRLSLTDRSGNTRTVTKKVVVGARRGPTSSAARPDRPAP